MASCLATPHKDSITRCLQQQRNRPQMDTELMPAVCRSQAHSSVKKATMIAGVTHLRLLKTAESDEWALQANTLEKAVQQDIEQGLIPFYLCGTIGTTSTATVDDLRGLGTVSKKHNIW